MRRVAPLALIVLPAMAMAQVSALPPLVRTTLAPATGVVIGQPVRLHVEVMFPGEMPHPPQVTLRDTPGAQILRFETQATTIRDRVNGQDYVGQSFEFLVFPRRGGSIAIPAPAVTLLDRGGAPAGTATGDPTRFDVTVPAGLDASGPVLAADRVTAEESWSPDPGATRFRQGGAIVRTIRRQAGGVPALGMAEFRFTAPEGVRVYVEPPLVEDRTARGMVDGFRTDKATYVFEQPGTYALPELAQPWWDIANKQARTETLPGLSVLVAAQAQGGPRDGVDKATRRMPVLLGAGLGVALLLALAALFRRRLVAMLDGIRRSDRSSGRVARKAFRRAAASGDAAQTYRTLSAWLDHLPPATAGRLRSDSRIAPLLDTLARKLFADGADWDAASGALLSQAMADAHRDSQVQARSPDPLPPLNPAYPPADLRRRPQ